MFDTVLVANRGEIAVRVIATLRRMGLRSVAIYSDEDEGARHVREADLALRVGPTAALESYLHVERVIEAATRSGAQAVHPGYGFLSENANFARACARAGLVFVGPSAESVEMMGDKIRAKAAVAAAGVRVVPGRAEPGMSDEELTAAAEEVGFPLLVKPSAGGGGKGMRLVAAREELASALVSARRESAASFGDDTLFLERFVQTPRHLEVQILFDNFGHGLHLGERECSLQRRHQKVIEEAPAPGLDDETRAALAAAALAVGEVAHYRGVGTVEFIASARRPDEFFFMEMNTRLQVEHPVTEMVTGVDLVEQQLRVAAGEELALSQDALRPTGHAIEARLYAEDPSRDFLPTGGDLFFLREPRGEGLRVDSSLLEGSRVGTSYDPLLAKVVAHGADRPQAVARLERAVSELVTFGVVSNARFLRSLLADDQVRAGALDTGLVARVLKTPPVGDGDGDATRAAAFAVAHLLGRARRTPGRSRFDVPDGWRLGEHATTSFSVLVDGSRHLRVRVAGSWRDPTVGLDDEAMYPVRCRAWRALSAEVDELVLQVGGRASRVLVGRRGDRTWIWCHATTSQWREVAPVRGDAAGLVHSGEVRSPMPGVVIALAVREGTVVSRGDPLLVVEAMKMEHTVVAPFDGVVGDVAVALGDQVVLDQVVVRVRGAMEAEGPSSPAPGDE